MFCMRGVAFHYLDQKTRSQLMRRIVVPVLVVAFLFALFLCVSASDKRPILISCPNTPGNPVINPDTLKICPGEVATFTATLGFGGEGCGDSVKIAGDPPINTFWLTATNSQKVVLFQAADVYGYFATRYAGGAPQGSSEGAVEVSSVGCPTMTEWGIVSLVGLIVASAIYIMLRRRKAAVTA
jgi:hypothetical protein